METQILNQMKDRVETLWVAIRQSSSASEQERLRREYRDALDTYRLQKLICQGKGAQAA